MEKHLMFGGIFALIGIVDLAVVVAFVLPRKGVPRAKKRVEAMVFGGAGIFALLTAAVISVAGKGWFG